MDIGVCGGRGGNREPAGVSERAAPAASRSSPGTPNLSHLQIPGPTKESSDAVEAASLRDMVEGGLRRQESEQANM